MVTISVDQRFALLAKLGENLNWDSLTSDQVQVGIREAHTFAAREFMAFIRNGFRMQINDFFRETGEVTLQIPALPRPTFEELCKEFSWIESIESDTSPTEAVILRLGTVLRLNEERVNGAEYQRRIALKLDIGLGYQQAIWLVEHQDEFPEFMVLLGKVYIDFPGFVVVDAHGGRLFPCLNQGGGRWDLDWGWVGDGLSRDGRVALSGK